MQSLVSMSPVKERLIERLIIESSLQNNDDNFIINYLTVQVSLLVRIWFVGPCRTSVMGEVRLTTYQASIRRENTIKDMIT